MYLKIKSRLDKLNEIKRYYEAGYCKRSHARKSTLVAVDNVANNTIPVLDPASNQTDMWSKYN